MQDPYTRSEKFMKEPPATFSQRLKHLGPGFILSASIVGSGELIATTTLGARAGFIAFWVIIVSCLVKVAVQLEVGRYTIITGKTIMSVFNNVRGPRVGRGGWLLWLIFGIFLLKFVQLGGMVGSTAIVLHMLMPAVGVAAWVVAVAAVAALLIFRGVYTPIEKASLFMTVSFTALTLASVAALAFTPYALSWEQIGSGLTFAFPPEIIPVAVGAFGITGVASDEIIAYNYWCIEKGYAANTGPQSADPLWERRARGWVEVMYLDAIVAMVVYTMVTAAFYLLGAAILNNRAAVPGGNELIETIALIYTESLGPGVRMVYLVGAFFVLFSSIFATLAVWTRIYPDIFGHLDWIQFSNPVARRKTIGWLAFLFPACWALVYLFVELPVTMILFGGLVSSALLVIMVAIVIPMNTKTRAVVSTGPFYQLAFYVSVVSIFAIGLYGVVSVISR
ncbi:MAG TPA: Nramp family divalent metal transporter [Chryseosolibacter sp.]|nr:Nramp family divalent metal transporter [Chryseosolibacter sp.]